MSDEERDNFLKRRVAEAADAVQKGETDTLSLVKLSLSSIPEEVFTLTECKRLILSSDAVVDMRSVYIDEEFWWETAFDNNMIASIPPQIQNLKNLEVLEIDQNMLYGLPPEIGKLANLRVLRLRNNYIKAVPPEIGELQHLELLDLSFNLIESLPPHIGNLKNLRRLNLACNNLSKLPEELASLANLEFLSIENYDENRVFSETAERFDLQQNRVTRLPESMAKMPNLKEFFCAHNPLHPDVLTQIEFSGAEALVWAVYMQGEEEGE